MGKATKRTKKFLKNNLDKTLKDRKAYQKKKSTIERANAKKGKSNLKRNGLAGARGEQEQSDDQDQQDEDQQVDSDQEEEEEEEGEEGLKGMSVADFLGGGFKTGMESDDDDDDDEDGEGSETDGQDEEEKEDGGEREELKEIQEMDEDEELDPATHAEQLSKLAEKDPAFYKYLQENDADLLNFANEDQDGDGDGDEDDDEDEDGEEEEDEEERDHQGDSEMRNMGAGLKEGENGKGPKVLTEKMLRGWQRSMIKNRSLRSFRKLLLAFRSASRFDSQDDLSTSSQSPAYIVNSAKVFNKLVLTTLKYTPVILSWHIPYKMLPDGSTKVPTNNKTWKTLRRPISSYFNSIRRLLKGLTEHKILYVTVQESEKVLPWFKEEKRGMREFLKILLDLWSTSQDQVRIAAFLVIRKIAATGDEAMMDMCLKGAYHCLIRSTKLTTIHTLPSINLLKNTFSSLYSLDSSASYQHAFGFIRQLAILLRNCIKNKTEESFRNVLNWQFVHCVDAWADLLGRDAERAAGISQDDTQEEKEKEKDDSERINKKGKKGKNTARNLPTGNVEDSPLRPLVYPLVQVALGVAKLMPTSRYFPLRLHLIRSLILLSSRTKLYIPLCSLLFEIFSSSEFQRRPKGSTLAPVDLNLIIRVPQPYVRTKVYSDLLAEEASHLLLFFLEINSENLGFPELLIPIELNLKRILKGNLNPKLQNELKLILEKANLNSKRIQNSRIADGISPKDHANAPAPAAGFGRRGTQNENPLQGTLRLARKVRDQKREIVNQKNQKIEA